MLSNQSIIGNEETLQKARHKEEKTKKEEKYKKKVDRKRFAEENALTAVVGWRKSWWRDNKYITRAFFGDMARRRIPNNFRSRRIRRRKSTCSDGSKSRLNSSIVYPFTKNINQKRKNVFFQENRKNQKNVKTTTKIPFWKSKVDTSETPQSTLDCRRSIKASINVYNTQLTWEAR